MTWIVMMDSGLAKDSSIKLSDFVKFSKLIVRVASTATNSVKLTKCCTKMAVCVI